MFHQSRKPHCFRLRLVLCPDMYCGGVHLPQFSSSRRCLEMVCQWFRGLYLVFVPHPNRLDVSGLGIAELLPSASR